MRPHLLLALAALGAAARPDGASAAGDPRRGEALYLGAVKLENGGAPCLACHALSGHGLAWAASFGPDLSAVPASYDADALEGVLVDVPFPSMGPIYRAHAIMPGERADLVAFLLETRAVPPHEDARGRLALEAGAIALVLLAVLVLLDRRRMPPLRARLAPRPGQGGTR
jgi:mono/diheme cytochrome c family protein